MKKLVIYDVAKLQEKKEVVDLVKLGKIKEINAIPAVLFVDDDFYEAKPSCRIEGYANFDDFMLTLKKNNGLSFCSP